MFQVFPLSSGTVCLLKMKKPEVKYSYKSYRVVDKLKKQGENTYKHVEPFHVIKDIDLQRNENKCFF